MKNRIISISLVVALVLSVGLIGCAGEEVPEIAEYDLTISSTEGGEVTTPGEGTFTYDGGTEVFLMAAPATGYRFVNWTGDADTIGDVDAAATTITMNDNYSITATFAVRQYSLVIHSMEGGSVTTPGENAYTYDKGEVVNLAAVADEGYQFIDWTGDVSTIADVNAGSTTITMNGGYSITANFAGAIRDWYDLDAIRDNLGGSYILMNNLDSTSAGYEELASQTANGGRGWEPIERLSGDPSFGIVDSVHFTGILNGQGYEIRDLYMDRTDEDWVGLFRFSDGSAIIKDIGIVDITVTGNGMVGGLVGGNGGTVSNSYSTGSVTGLGPVGGLVGGNGGTLNNCYFTGSVTGGANGGLVGWNDRGTVINSYSTGSMTGNSAGGLVGQNHEGTVSNSYYNYDEVLINGKSVITIGALSGEDFDQWLANDRSLDINERLSQEDGYYLINDISHFKQLLAFGQDSSLKFRLEDDLDLSGEANFYIPYLAGEFDGNGHKIRNLRCHFDSVAQVGLFGYLAFSGRVSEVGVENIDLAVTGGGDQQVGGLVGGSSGAVSEAYSTGSMSGSHQVGGLVGWNVGTVSNSYSTGSVTGPRAGGLVGWNRDGTVSNSYSTGSVAGEWEVGGLAGLGDTVSNSFWDIETSGQDTSAGGTGKTTAEMKSITTFSGAGWNIIAVAPGERSTSYIWNIVDGQTYPFLSWEL